MDSSSLLEKTTQTTGYWSMYNENTSGWMLTKKETLEETMLLKTWFPALCSEKEGLGALHHRFNLLEFRARTLHLVRWLKITNNENNNQQPPSRTDDALAHTTLLSHCNSHYLRHLCFVWKLQTFRPFLSIDEAESLVRMLHSSYASSSFSVSEEENKKTCNGNSSLSPHMKNATGPAHVPTFLFPYSPFMSEEPTTDGKRCFQYVFRLSTTHPGSFSISFYDVLQDKVCHLRHSIGSDGNIRMGSNGDAQDQLFFSTIEDMCKNQTNYVLRHAPVDCATVQASLYCFTEKLH